jgi:two-component system nitrogen regulation response regulator GlnG
MPKALAVDDDRAVLHMLRQSLDELGVEVITASTAEAAVEAVRREQPDVVLLDIVLPGSSGLEIIKQIQGVDRRLPIIFITAGPGSDSAIEAMQLGAYDYVAKPLDLPRLNNLVAKALETRRLMNVPVAVHTGGVEESNGDAFVGRSPQMLDVFKSIGRVATQNVAVLVRGESGTGKELVARALYHHGNRRDAPFMAVNCAALPDSLLESELFGHEKGAFTGADRRRIGKFEQCNGGTLFLDEVGDMSPLLQGKVLRVLQHQQFERVGGNETIQTDVRLITATNRPLEEMVKRGTFRADLLYRLNGVTIFLPPLRERQEDLPVLLQHFLARATRDLDRPEIKGIAPLALDLLRAYPWPGNVRELQSVIRQAILKSTGPVLVPDFFPEEIQNGGVAEFEGDRHDLPSANLEAFVESRLRAGSHDLYSETVDMMERYLFTKVLQITDGNQTRASEILGVTRGKIRDRIAAFNISLEKNVTITD